MLSLIMLVWILQSQQQITNSFYDAFFLHHLALSTWQGKQAGARKVTCILCKVEEDCFAEIKRYLGRVPDSKHRP